jgi:hypothetical protein
MQERRQRRPSERMSSVQERRQRPAGRRSSVQTAGRVEESSSVHITPRRWLGVELAGAICWDGGSWLGGRFYKGS